MSHSMSIRLIGGLILTSALTASAPAAQADVVERSNASVTVHFDDLNLDAEAGAKALLNRIAIAGAKVCGARQNFRPMLAPHFETCRTTAVQSAIASVNHPLVNAIYANKQSTNKRLASSKSTWRK
jgi:UrcA family protein